MSHDMVDVSTNKPPARSEFVWPAAAKDGKPIKRQVVNVGKFLRTTGARVRHNAFTGLIEVSGLQHHGELTDRAVDTLWSHACSQGLQDDVDTFRRLLGVLADRNRFHPVLDYLDALQWDGRARLDAWLSTYVGAEDTPLNRAIGRATLIGAVRRVREPGHKFDTMLVLEGRQGSGKSSVVAILGGLWFADGLKLGWDAKQTIEATRGRWIVEVPELSGMTNKEVEAVKHQLSCSTDRARLAYDRLATSVPRQWVAVGTTNDDKYLKDSTGNRRFLPVKTGHIDLEALRRDRGQLWAEAVSMVELADTPAIVPEELWPAAAEAQEARRIAPPIEERLEDMLGSVEGNIVAKDDIWDVVGFGPAGKRTQAASNAMTIAMRKLGWKPSRQRGTNGAPTHVYVKDVPGLAERAWLKAWYEVLGGGSRLVTLEEYHKLKARSDGGSDSSGPAARSGSADHGAIDGSVPTGF